MMELAGETGKSMAESKLGEMAKEMPAAKSDLKELDKPLQFDAAEISNSNLNETAVENLNQEKKGLTDDEKNQIKDETGWSDEVEKSQQTGEENGDNAKNCPIDGNNGKWDGKRGNSNWIPEQDFSPGKANPEGKTWKEIQEKHGIEQITFKDGEPDFSEISKGKAEIEPFSDSRSDNFDKADIELAKQKGCTPEEVEKWRKENGYTWHECKDMSTMQKVPSEVHNNISHSGGISEVKKGNGDNI
ncbi:MAG: HNH endonuclease [Firmicutes bacterium]|nr:HNH endonuclease [Bacillota bacterium]